MPVPSESICAVGSSDYVSIAELFLHTFPAIDDRDFMYAWSNRDPQSSMALYNKSTLVGFGLVAPYNGGDDLTNFRKKLWFLAIHPRHRGGGAGTRLLKAILDTCDTLALCPVNEDAVIQWYKRHGFIISKTMPFIHADIPVHTMIWTRERERTRTTSNASTLSPSASVVSLDCLSDSSAESS